MRFIKYISEVNNIDDIDYISEIKDKCKKYIKDTSYNFVLYRGQWNDDSTSYLNGSIIKEKTIKNRLPRNTSKEVHTILNYGFKQVFGKNLRSETVFATSNEYAAMGYGDSYLFFPIDPFEIYWSPYIKDIFSFYTDLKNIDNNVLFKNPNVIISILYFIIENKSKIKSKTWNDETKNIIQNIINKYNSILPEKLKNIENIKENIKPYIENSIKDFIALFYKKGDLKAAIKSGNEVMVDCDQYFLVSPKNIKINEIWEK